MTYQDAINKFQKHLDKLNQDRLDFEIWFQGTLTYVDEIYGNSSQRNNINTIYSDLRISKLRLNTDDLRYLYQDKTTQLIESFIEDLKEKEKVAIKEQIQKEKEELKMENVYKQQIESFNKEKIALLEEINRSKQENNSINHQPKPKKIWLKVLDNTTQINSTLLFTILGGSFLLGTYIGNTVFNKDSIELKENNITLIKDTTSLKDSIRELNLKIENSKHSFDSLIKVDSF